jgi:cystathionine beta-lyase/cystathionine gamma-synthase
LVFRQQDLRAVAGIAAERGILTVIDNSWASPYFQNPTEFGIDLVLHSGTKYLGGHSDIVAGVVMGSRAHIDSLKVREGELFGGILDPFAAWLMLRGLRTLPVRLDRHQETALEIARFLEGHPAVSRVHYPGLRSDPQYELSRRQLRGESGLLSFELKRGTKEAACAVVDGLHYFGIGVSWGGFESLAIPITLPDDGRAGEPSWGIRLHAGLETADDLLEDLHEALSRVL